MFIHKQTPETRKENVIYVITISHSTSFMQRAKMTYIHHNENAFSLQKKKKQRLVVPPSGYLPYSRDTWGSSRCLKGYFEVEDQGIADGRLDYMCRT